MIRVPAVQTLSLYKLFQFVIKFRTGGSSSPYLGGGGIGALQMDSNLEDEWWGIVWEFRFLSLNWNQVHYTRLFLTHVGLYHKAHLWLQQSLVFTKVINPTSDHNGQLWSSERIYFTTVTHHKDHMFKTTNCVCVCVKILSGVRCDWASHAFHTIWLHHSFMSHNFNDLRTW